MNRTWFDSVSLLCYDKWQLCLHAALFSSSNKQGLYLNIATVSLSFFVGSFEREEGWGFMKKKNDVNEHIENVISIVMAINSYPIHSTIFPLNSCYRAHISFHASLYFMVFHWLFGCTHYAEFWDSTIPRPSLRHSTHSYRGILC